MPLGVLEQVDTLLGTKRFLITYTVTDAHSCDVLVGTDFPNGTDAPIDWERQRLTIGDTGGRLY